MNGKEAAELATILGSVIHDALGLADRATKLPYVYAVTLNFADAASIGTQATGSITIDSGNDFICTAVSVIARVDDTGRQLVGMAANGTETANLGGNADPSILLQIEDGSGDRLWHSQAVDAAAVYGPEAPTRGKLPVPRRLRAGNTTTITATTLKELASPTQGQDVRVHLIGFKVPRSV